MQAVVVHSDAMSAELLQVFLARLGVALCMDSLDVVGPASEILNCWAAVEPAWDVLLSSQPNQVQ